MRAPRSRSAWAFALLVVLAAGCGGGWHRPEHVTLATHAASGLADAPPPVDVRGLNGGERATLRATWTGFGGAVWTSRTPLPQAAGRGIEPAEGDRAVARQVAARECVAAMGVRRSAAYGCYR